LESYLITLLLTYLRGLLSISNPDPSLTVLNVQLQVPDRLALLRFVSDSCMIPTHTSGYSSPGCIPSYNLPPSSISLPLFHSSTPLPLSLPFLLPFPLQLAASISHLQSPHH
ncbi:hypothetical protein BDQ17DRAFT_1349504, partial [Cyathus striatus]